MKAFILDKYGKQSRLRLGEVPMPVLGDYELLIQVEASSVNLLDGKIKNGEFKPVLPYKVPLVLGHDIAGTVVQAGARVTQFKVGDEVFSRPDDFRIGGFAEYIAVKESSLALKPGKLSMVEAASVPLVGLTAWQALVEVANVRPGQKVFIQAGSGGVGTIAIQLAKYLGAYVATTTSTTNVEWVRELGADLVIDYKNQDFEKILKGYDVVLNSQDTETLVKSLRVLRPGGKLVTISGPTDPSFAATLKAPGILKFIVGSLSAGVRRKARQLAVDYSFLFMRADGAQLAELAKLVDSGVIRPVIDRVFPFEQTPEALAYVELGRAKGKVVIEGASGRS